MDVTERTIPPHHEEPFCSFGIIADVQYGDLDEQYNYKKTSLRFYRTALTLLRRAITHWTEEHVNCVLQLGDIIDGRNRSTGASSTALATVVGVLKQFPGPVYHTLGNHELYNFTHEELLRSAIFSGNMPQCKCPDGKTYYSFNIHRKLKVLVLNCYEISMLGLPEDCDQYKEAKEFITENNPNKDLNSAEGLRGVNRRFVKFNGLVSASQLEWLTQNLREAMENEENVIIMGHSPICEHAANSMALCLNFTDIMEAISAYSTCVLCYICGHDHDGGSYVDDYRILHVTFPGTVESYEPDAYATAYLYNNRLVIDGKGSYHSYETKLRFVIEERDSSLCDSRTKTDIDS